MWLGPFVASFCSAVAQIGDGFETSSYAIDENTSGDGDNDWVPALGHEGARCRVPW